MGKIMGSGFRHQNKPTINYIFITDNRLMYLSEYLIMGITIYVI